MKAEILVTEEEQESLGFLVLRDGRIVADPASDDALPILESIIEEDVVIVPGTDRELTALSDPEGWLKNLPALYNGSRMRAAFIP